MTRPLLSVSLSRLFFSLLALGAGACAEPDLDDQASDEIGIEQEEAAPDLLALAAAGDTSICCGTKTTLAESIKAAENLFISSDERLFVSGDDGVYELLAGSDGKRSVQQLVSSDKCAFGGITETRGVLYANCYASGASYVYATKLDAPANFQVVATMKGTNLANGLTSDGADHLYVACTGQNRILRLTLSASDPLSVAKQEVWLDGAGLFVNGLKFYDSALYWTDFTAVKSASVQANGKPSRVRTLTQRLTFLDDLFVDEQGLLVADWLGGALRIFSAQGREVDRTKVALDMPSAVIRADGRAGFSQHALIVTEKNANRVTLYEPK